MTESTADILINGRIAPVVGSGQEFTEVTVPEEYCSTMGPRKRGEVSRGKQRLRHVSLKTLLGTVFISTVLWKLFCSFHAVLRYDEPLPPNLSPWTDLLSIENDLFEQLLTDMATGCRMSTDVKDAQTKITDLRTLIRASGRSRKDLLANDLSALLSEAKKSRKDLQTFATNIGQSLQRIMETNDRALQRMKRVIANEYRVLRVPLKTIQTSIISDFEEAMNVLHKSFEVMCNDIESYSNGLRRIDEDLKGIVRSLRRYSDGELRQPSEVGEPPTKQFERYLRGLTDLESYADQGFYVIGSASNVIRDAKQQLDGIRDWKLVGWSALNRNHIKPIVVELEKLRVVAQSAQDRMLTRKV